MNELAHRREPGLRWYQPRRFQSFVSWRYLMAPTPRRVSEPVVAFVLICAWAALFMLAYQVWIPLLPPYAFGSEALSLLPVIGVAIPASLLPTYLGVAAVTAATSFGRTETVHRALKLASFCGMTAIAGTHVAIALTRGADVPMYVAVALQLAQVVAAASFILLFVRSWSRWLDVIGFAGAIGLFLIAHRAARHVVRSGFEVGGETFLADAISIDVILLVGIGSVLVVAGGVVCALRAVRRFEGSSESGKEQLARSAELPRRFLRWGGIALAGLALIFAGVVLLEATWVKEIGEPTLRLLGIGPGEEFRPLWVVGGQRAAIILGSVALALCTIRYYFTFFSTVSVGGVTVGTMALIMVLSVMSGFETDLRTKILGSNAHILITKPEGDFEEYRELYPTLEKVEGVVAHSPYLMSEVVIAARQNYANVIIKAVDPTRVGDVTNITDDIEEDLEDPLNHLFPLAPDGSVLGPPSREKPPTSGTTTEGKENGIDPAPDDFDIPDADPLDLSGGGEPDDLSGGAELGASDATERDGGIDDGDQDFDAVLDGQLGEPPTFGMSPEVAVLPGVFVGRELVKQLSNYVGQEVLIVSPLGQDTPLGPVPRTKPYRVAATFYTGMYEYDLKYVYVELRSLQEFLDIGDQVNGIEIRVEDPNRTGPIIAELAETLGPSYRVQDWRELNRSLFSALKLEKIAMFIVLAIIILVASFSIVGNLVMIVIEKAREIAVLKTLGATDRSITGIFIGQGLVIGFLGMLVGVGLGLIHTLITLHEFPIDANVYYIKHLPIQLEPISVVYVAIAAVVISTVATLYPARLAASQRPVEGLARE